MQNHFCSLPMTSAVVFCRSVSQISLVWEISCQGTIASKTFSLLNSTLSLAFWQIQEQNPRFLSTALKVNNLSPYGLLQMDCSESSPWKSWYLELRSRSISFAQKGVSSQTPEFQESFASGYVTLRHGISHFSFLQTSSCRYLGHDRKLQQRTTITAQTMQIYSG